MDITGIKRGCSEAALGVLQSFGPRTVLATANQRIVRAFRAVAPPQEIRAYCRDYVEREERREAYLARLAAQGPRAAKRRRR